MPAAEPWYEPLDWVLVRTPLLPVQRWRGLADGAPPIDDPRVRRALAERAGDVLCFLPGVGEIARVAGQLGGAGDVDVLQVHGRAPAAVQDAVLTAGARRRVVLATSVAAAASHASARAMPYARALSARLTRPAPSAMLHTLLLLARNACVRSVASLMRASRTATRRSQATRYAMSL